MKLSHRLAPLVLTAMLAGCSTLTPVSRDAPDRSDLLRISTRQAAHDWRLAAVRVSVPEDLKVSEANSYYPIADIVWRGDPRGDRRAQVADLLQGAVAEGLRDLQGTRPVVVDVEVRRFHSLTEKTRYTFGGTHAIHLRMSVRDAATGAVLYGPRRIDASLAAYGGQKAIEAEARGETQKVRITRHVAGLMRAELGIPATRVALAQ